MNFVLDSNAYSAVQRGNAVVMRLMEDAAHVFVPVIVEGELRGGFAHGTKKTENYELLDKYLSRDNVSILGFSPHTPGVFAEIYAELRSTGQPIGQNDMWIAAVAREHQLPILTLDSDFTRVRGIELVPVVR